MINLSILLVDDEISFLRTIRRVLWQEGYSNITIETNPLEVPSILENQRFDLAIIDFSMPEMNGLELLEFILAKSPETVVLILTAKDSFSLATTAMKLGAYEYLVKPPDIQRLLLSIKNSTEKFLLKREVDTIRKISDFDIDNPDMFSDIIGKSQSIKKVINLVNIYSRTDDTVFLSGETGTGKDLIAKKIHTLSSRVNNPFVSVNMASLSSTLFESELFGAEKGSYTGSNFNKIGFFEAANEGTIYLDELAEIPDSLQSKLLRVIQYGEFYRIGSTKPIKLTARIIASTNKDIISAIKRKEFRNDLYFRLTRGYILLPPLRDRVEDIELICNYFLTSANKKYGKNFLEISKISISKLKSYDFPGNIRELENLIFHAVAISNNHKELTVPIELIQTKEHSEINFPLMNLKDMISMYVNNVVEQCEGNTVKAASILGVSERTIQRRVK